MQEFSSISVSSYEAASLTERLNEQSAAGWDVVAIVPTGSTVTAYLARDKSEDEPESDSTELAATTPAADATDTAPESPSGADEAPVVTAAAAAAAAAANDVDEAPGWAADADTDPAPRDDMSDLAALAATVKDEPTLPESSAAAGATPVAAAVASAADEPAKAEPAPEPEPAGATTTPAAATTAAAATPAAAPPGWYSDPSTRFELRYWDGGQWTEHVSRSGQQFTDPPVA